MLIKTMLSSISLLLGFFWEATACSVSVQPIPDLGRRGLSYTVSSNEPFVKDSALWSGWYAANDGNRVYSILNGTVPDVGRCGTYYPVYVKDHVSDQLTNGKEYNFTACLVTDDNSCKLQYAIKIRRCDSAIHYYLVPTNGESAYCFEPSAAVEPSPNYSIEGGINVTVALMYIDVNNVSEPQLDFKCNFQADNRFYYEISWAINGLVEKTYLPVTIDRIDATNLKETDIINLGFTLGFTVRCLVRISYSQSGNRTNPQLSDEFYAGIKTSNYIVTLSRTGNESIEIWATFPFGCRKGRSNLREPCEFEIQMFNPNTSENMCDISSQVADDQTACTVVLNGLRKSDNGPCLGGHDISRCTYTRFKEGSQRKVLYIAETTSQSEFTRNDHKTRTLQLQGGKLPPHAILKNAKMDQITVFYDSGNGHESSWKSSRCYAISDPNIYTFNGDKFYFDDIGHFLLYRNNKLRHEVQIKTKRCKPSLDNSVACTCAVSVQAGGEVFVIDVCGDISRASFSNCRGNVLNVRLITDQTYERDGNTELWTQSSFLAWMSTVETEIRRNKTYQEEKQDVVQVFQNISCPFDCNGNGDCMNGSCMCREDFEGDSCFVRRSAVLEMTDVEGGGLCDLTHGVDCHECLQFHTQNLLKKFQCKLIDDDIDISGRILNSEELRRAGEYENMFEGYCCPSTVSRRKKRSLTSETFIVRYNISISNDGVHFSESKFVYVYDSKCQQYLSTDGEFVFSLKDNTCFIEGECFGNGESMADSTCCPIVSAHDWTSLHVCTEASGNGKDKVILIAAICGSVGGVLVIALIVCVIICKLKANESYRVSDTSLNTKTAPYYVNTSFKHVKDEMFETNSITGSRVFDSNENKHFDAKHGFFDRN